MSGVEFKPKTSSKVDFSKAFDASVLNGCSVLITGGASGLGACFASDLAGKGCYVTIVDTNEELAKSFITEHEANGLKINFAKADVTSYTALLDAFKAAVKFSSLKTVDIVIPCAGLFGPPINALLPDTASMDDPPEPSTSVLDVNFKGVYYTTYLALHYFRLASKVPSETSKRPKHILFICSILAYLEASMNLSYCGSKHAIRGMFRSLRWEGNELQIPDLRVNLVAPTLMTTPMTHAFASYLQDVRGFKLGPPEEAVEAGLRLLCDYEINGRAVAVVPGFGPVDLCDDFEGQDGARESLKLVQENRLGAGPSASGRFIV